MCMTGKCIRDEDIFDCCYLVFSRPNVGKCNNVNLHYEMTCPETLMNLTKVC
jgi:hypothetical protein